LGNGQKFFAKLLFKSNNLCGSGIGKIFALPLPQQKDRFQGFQLPLPHPCSNVHKYTGPPELSRSEISFLRTCNIPKQYKSTQEKSYLNELCILLVF